MDDRRENIERPTDRHTDEYEYYYDPYADWPKEKLGEPFFPYHVLKELALILLIIGLVVYLAAFHPFEMLPKADPFSTPEHIKPEWYFLAVYQFLKVAETLRFLGKWVPKVIGIFGPVVILLLIAILPFLDRNPERHPKKRPILTLLGILFIIVFVIFTIWGHYS